MNPVLATVLSPFAGALLMRGILYLSHPEMDASDWWVVAILGSGCGIASLLWKLA